MTTALAPALWGTTYLTTTSFLPEDRPLLAATLRALPAGLLLLLLCRRLPRGGWWWKSWVLGVLNIGAFFALLFIAAYRLPGGVAAIGGTLSMASGIVLSKKWGHPAPPLTTTAWQLITGGLTLLVVMLMIEGLPVTPLTPSNILGYIYLSVVGTAFAYVLWFRGIARLPASTTAFLGLLSPVVAILLGWMMAGEGLTSMQIAGIVIVLGSIAAAIVSKSAKPVRADQGSAKEPAR